MNDRNYFEDWVFSALAGDRVTITMDRTSGGIDPLLRLYSSAADKLAENDDGGSGNNARISNYRISRSGEYTIHALRYGTGASGGYRLSLSGQWATPTPRPSRTPVPTRTPIPTSTPEPRQLAIGHSATGVLSSSSTSDQYTFEAREGYSVAITMARASRSLDPKLRLYTSAGRALAESAGTREVAEIRDFRIPASGSFTIRAVRIGGAGDYRLSLFGAKPTPPPSPTLEPTATTPPTATSTPTLQGLYNSSDELMSDHGIRLTAPGSMQWEVIYPAVSEDIPYDLLGDLQLLDSASIRTDAYYPRVEVCFPDGEGIFLQGYWHSGDTTMKLAPLIKRQVGNLTCVNVTVASRSDTILRVNDRGLDLRHLRGDAQCELVDRIYRAMPNPLAFVGWSALCLVQEFYNVFLTSPIGEFSYAFSKALYNDTKAIYSAAKSAVDKFANTIVEAIVEGSELVHDFVSENAEAAVEYVANQMETRGIELPTDDEVEEWVVEFFHGEFYPSDSESETITLGKSSALDRVFHNLAEGAFVSGTILAVVNQAQHLPRGLSNAQKVSELLRAAPIFRGQK